MKRFFYKVYDPDGNFISTISDVADDPIFTSYINSGLGDLTIRLPRSIFQYEETTVIAHNNQIKVICVDDDAPEGVLIYSGYISKYAPTLDNGQQYITVTCLGYISETQRFMAEDASGNTTLVYDSQDPSDILKDIIDKFVDAGGHPNYTVSSVETTGTVVTYTFNTYLVKEALDEIISLAPSGWYYFIDADNIVHFGSKKSTPDHIFVLGKDVVSMTPEKSVENMCNRVFFTGADASGTPIYKKYERASSISTYGQYDQKHVDATVSDPDTMDIIAGSILDSNDAPETRTTLIIRDNNSDDGRGYDIESIQCGQTCKIIGWDSKNTNLWDSAVWDTSHWDYDLQNVSASVQQIVEVSYQPNQVILVISSKLPNISHRVEDIKRNMDRIFTNANPTTPS